jgi:hypothetical protein
MSESSSSKHFPVKLPVNLERLKLRLLMLFILAGYILAFLISAGVFAGNKKLQPPLTMPIMSQESTFNPIDQVPSFPKQTDGLAISATLFFQFDPKLRPCGNEKCTRADDNKKSCKGHCIVKSKKDK